MRKILSVLIALSFTLACGAAMACDSEKEGETADNIDLPADAVMTKVVLNVSDATCGGCVVGIRKELTALKGVADVQGSEDDYHLVTVTVAEGTVSNEELIAAVKKAGYTATVQAADKTS